VGNDKERHPTSIKTLPHCMFSCSSVLKEYNCWWKRHIAIITTTRTLDDGQSPLPNVTIQEMCLYLDITVQMRHNQKDTLKGYWSTLEVLHGLLRKHYETRQSLSYT
jgi:hypothetical protein